MCMYRKRFNITFLNVYLTHRDVLLEYFRNTDAHLSLKTILSDDIQENTLISAFEKCVSETQRCSILNSCE